MSTYIAEIKMKLPSLNEYIKSCNSSRYKGNQMKQDIQKQIYYFIKDLPKFENPVKINFLWIESDKRRDLDNICFAKKFILDALVKYGKLKNDNRKNVYAFTDEFSYGKETAVILTIEE